jgi:hypothetical protein
MKNIISKISTNKKQIIVRTLVVAGAVVGVTLAAGLIKIVPTEKTVDAVETVAKAAKKAAE